MSSDDSEFCMISCRDGVGGNLFRRHGTISQLVRCHRARRNLCTGDGAFDDICRSHRVADGGEALVGCELCESGRAVVEPDAETDIRVIKNVWWNGVLHARYRCVAQRDGEQSVGHRHGENGIWRVLAVQTVVAIRLGRTRVNLNSPRPVKFVPWDVTRP